ncbi:MAG: GTPase ObgE, partial [Cyanobacteria bacterium J06553_1]
VDEIASQLNLITGEKVFRVSAVSQQGTEELLQAVWALLDETNAAIAAEEARAAQALIEFNTPVLRSTL